MAQIIIIIICYYFYYYYHYYHYRNCFTQTMYNRDEGCALRPNLFD